MVAKNRCRGFSFLYNLYAYRNLRTLFGRVRADSFDVHVKFLVMTKAYTYKHGTANR